ncbi:MAG: lipoyl synthase [Nitrospira sp.]|nr:lipoyl synthase [bacterium]MBL7049897.1 lipoyl synthase [Nitrospira sp.]
MRHPEWIRVSLAGRHDTKKILRSHGVSTVCEEARCPNQGKCFSESTATFMILGDRCTRNCGFCAVAKSVPLPVDLHEPEKVAGAAAELGLKYIVITSVTRDDLIDGGALQFSKVISAVRKLGDSVKIEVLTPDFQGSLESLKIVLDAQPDVFNHNMETVRRLYPTVRPMADYALSLEILRQASAIAPAIKTKSGIMLGLGETESEVLRVMQDLRDAHCDYLTIGQYLRPRKANLSIVEYIRPEVFEQYKVRGLDMGFLNVASSPLTRSSMDAGKMYENV